MICRDDLRELVTNHAKSYCLYDLIPSRKVFYHHCFIPVPSLELLMWQALHLLRSFYLGPNVNHCSQITCRFETQHKIKGSFANSSLSLISLMFSLDLQ